LEGPRGHCYFSDPFNGRNLVLWPMMHADAHQHVYTARRLQDHDIIATNMIRNKYASTVTHPIRFKCHCTAASTVLRLPGEGASALKDDSYTQPRGNWHKDTHINGVLRYRNCRIGRRWAPAPVSSRSTGKIIMIKFRT